MGGGRKKSKKKKTKTKAQKMAVANKKKYGGTAKAAAANKKSMQNKAKSYTKTSGAATAAANNKAAMKKKAEDRNKKFQQTKVQTFGGKKTSFTPKEQTRIKDAGYKVEGYSQAKFKPTPKPTPKVNPIDGTKIASHDKPLFKSPPASGPAADVLAGPEFKRMYLDGGLIKGGDSGLGGRVNPMGIGTDLVSTNTSGLGIDVSPKATGFTPMMPGLATSLGIDSKTGLDSEGKGPSYLSTKSPESFGAPSQAETDKAAGITAGGLNVGGSGFTPSKPSGNTNARALFPGASPNSPVFGMTDAQLNQPGGPFAQPGPTPENTPEADYTSYQPGSFYNQSDTNMNPTNFLRSTRNVITTPFRALGINNGLTNMLIPKSNEAIQDARDQRGPRPTLTRRGGGGGARLPVAPLTPEEILEETAVAPTVPDYQQAPIEQTGVDPNRLMQIQQDAYIQAFNPTYNPMFRFFDRRRGARRGAFRKAFRRD